MEDLKRATYSCILKIERSKHFPAMTSTTTARTAMTVLYFSTPINRIEFIQIVGLGFAIAITLIFCSQSNSKRIAEE